MFWRKWPTASKLFAALALLCGGAAFVLVRAESARVEALRPGEPVPIVVAVGDLPAGTRLEPAMLREESVPSSFAPPGAVPSVGKASGRTLVAPIASGEALTDTRISAGRGGPIAVLVPAGLRAFALPPDVPAGGVRAGDRIDVFATYTSGAPHTELVAGGIQVIGEVSPAGQASIEGAAAKPMLEVLVSPGDASRLAYASTFAKISVGLLGPDETASPTPAALPGTTPG